METNKIIEISGIADIYIRAICDIEDKYHEGDLVATLYSKPINFTFKPQNAEARKGINNLLSFFCVKRTPTKIRFAGNHFHFEKFSKSYQTNFDKKTPNWVRYLQKRYFAKS